MHSLYGQGMGTQISVPGIAITKHSCTHSVVILQLHSQLQVCHIMPLLCVVIKLACTNIINLSYEKTQMSVYIVTLNTLCHIHVCNTYMLCQEVLELCQTGTYCCMLPSQRLHHPSADSPERHIYQHISARFQLQPCSQLLDSNLASMCDIGYITSHQCHDK